MPEEALEKVDLSFDERKNLHARAMACLAEGNLEQASILFSAAIRKARRANLWDVEAEYLRFVTLYLSGDYTEAVNRCVACLDALHEISKDREHWPVDRLPIRPVRAVLERALLQALFRRGDSVLAVTRHLWRPHEGKVYGGKRTLPLTQAFREAWAASRTPFEFGIETLSNEFRPFVAVLEEKYAQGSGGEAAAGRPAAAPASASPLEAKEEVEAARVVDEILRREGWSATDDELRILLDACARTESAENVERFAKAFARAPARESRKILHALRANGGLSKAVEAGRFEDARPEIVRFLHLAFGTPERRKDFR